jgi:hypothetical protein
MIIEVVFGLMYVVAAAVALWSISQLRQFLDDTPSIADEMSLDRFKALARTQMYLALAVIPILVTGGALGIALISWHGMTGVAVVILTNMLFFGLAMYHRSFETRTRSLKASSEMLGQEYRQVCETWVKKALPDF